MKSKIKILDLRDSSWVDGPGRTILETAEGLDPSRFEVTVGGFVGSPDADSEYLKSARNRGLPTLKIVERGALDLNVVRQVLGAIRDRKIDLIHTHEFRTDLFGLICARKSGLPAISTCHGWIANDLKGRIYRNIDKYLLRRFDKVVTVSNTMVSELVRHGVARARIAVIVNSLKTSDFVPDPVDTAFRDELGILSSDTLIASIGRLSPEKGHDVLIEALASLSCEAPSICVAIVGHGQREHALKEMSNSLGLDGLIHFVGYRTDMTAIYNAADLVVQSSFTEGMPNVILESLLMETPVIATDVGGTSEVIEHGNTGLLIPAGDKDALVRSIRNFIDDREQHKRFARRGRRRVARDFDHDVRVQRTASMYVEAIEGNLA